MTPGGRAPCPAGSGAPLRRVPSRVRAAAAAVAAVVPAVLVLPAAVAPPARAAAAPADTPVAGPGPVGAARGVPLCRLSDSRIDEASGLAVAAGLWWTHDDSGGPGPARLYGLDRMCRTVTVLEAVGTRLVDPEDLGSATGDARGPVLWLADTGDNRAARGAVTLVRLRVPDLPAGAGRTGRSVPGGAGSRDETGAGGGAASGGPDASGGVSRGRGTPGTDAEAPVVGVAADTFRVEYADGPRDAEALLVDPRVGPVVVSKPLVGSPGVYVPASPLDPRSTTVLRRVGDVRLGGSAVPPTRRGAGPAGPLSPWLVTGGAVSPDGRGVALLTYTDVHVWWTRTGVGSDGGPGLGRLDVGGPDRGGLDVAALLGRPPDAVLPLPPLDQAEAVAWTEDARGLLVTSEGRGAPLLLLPVGGPPVDAAAPGRAPGDGATLPPDTGTGAPDAGVAATGPGGAPAAEVSDRTDGRPYPPSPGERDAVPAVVWPVAATVLSAGWPFRAVLRRRRAARLARRTQG